MDEEIPRFDAEPPSGLVEQPPAVDAEGLEPQTIVEQPPRLPFPVVGLGASAGGLAALVDFFTAMRPDSGMAFVVVQHLPPDHQSMMADILGRKTAMPVLQVADGMPVEPNHVYVIRPGHQLLLRRGLLRLGARLGSARAADRPIDDFFKSLAEDQRERAVAVIMSGMGSNGTGGAQAIKAVGGLCVAQDPDSAESESMPRHLIEAGHADYILRPADMPEVLLAYAGHPYARRTDVEEAVSHRDAGHVREILAILRIRTRNDYSGYKKPTVLRRIQRRMGLGRVTSLAEYAKLLRQSPTEVASLAEDLLIHVTGFFRDAEAWDALRQRVVVPLVASREPGGSIRCWVTACSTGEEAYTLAMLLVEEAERVGKLLDIKVFATDLGERSLVHARAGLYPGGIEAEMSAERLERFFEREDAVYRVRAELREVVVFAPQNLLQDPPFSRLDIATCRNLLIYLEPDVQQKVIGLLHFGLREGGALFLGASETVAAAEELFELLDKRARIYRRIGPTRHGAMELPIRALGAAARGGVAPGSAGETRSGRFDGARAPGRSSAAQITQQALLDHHTPPAVLVGRDHHVLYFHGNTHPFLEQPPGEPTRDLMALARDGLRAGLRTALHRAVAEDGPVSVRDGWLQAGPSRRIRVGITVSPVSEPAGAFVVSFEERGEIETSPSSGEPQASPDGHGLTAELRRVKEELQSTIEELQTSNEELRASHEELTSMNEELQSTNEELETSKEEMQSLNEELTTLNSQLQAKMEEHQAASNDLTSLLSSTDIAVIFLDPRFRIRRFTPAVRDLLELITSDVGRPLSDLARRFHDPTLLEDARVVLERLLPIEAEISADHDRHFLRRITPYRTTDNRIDGVVIAFIDISARKRTENALRETEAQLRSVADLVPDLLWQNDPRGSIDWCNRRWLDYTGQSLKEAVGYGWLDVIHPDDRVHSREAFQAAIDTGEPLRIEHRMRRAADGSYRWFLVQALPLRDERGGVARWLGAATDVHVERMALDAIRETEQRFRLVVQGAQEFAFIVTDVQDRITVWSPGAERLFGVSEAEVIGRGAAFVYTPEDRAAGVPEHEIAETTRNDVATDERWHARADGSRFWASGARHALRGASGELRGFLKVLRDETTRKAFEQTLQRAKEAAEEANRIKDEFLATLSHELRNPLAAILLWSKLLQGAGSRDPAQLEEGLKVIREAAESQGRLVDDLLESSRIAAGKLRLQLRGVDLEGLVRNAVNAIVPTAAAKGVEVDVAVRARIPEVLADPGRLRQVMWNLLTNAVKFTTSGERIDVSLDHREGRSEISVADTGQGIEPAFLPHVFDLFRQADSSSTRRHGGLGLGLAVAKQIVELHGGTIGVRSDGPGRGTTFTVRLPDARRAKLGEESAAVPPSAGPSTRDGREELRGERVLVVEDDPRTLRALSILLAGADAAVTACTSAGEALRWLETGSADLLLSDIGLPEMDGYDLIRRIRREETETDRPRLCAVALTAFARDDDRRKAIDAGFDAYVAKPIDPDDLLDVLKRVRAVARGV